jgi:2-polyprenyl-6-methoxyphenol hydroxylase-like FAD-dependent oxidoreductase
MNDSVQMPKQTITIIGAGISGLTLGRCLLQRNIPAILYERTTSPQHHNYGITLHDRAYQPLLRALSADEDAFKRKVAVDAAMGGCGDIGPAHRGSFRANRGMLEEWLRDGLDIRFQHTLQRVTRPQSSQEPMVLGFDNGTEVCSEITIGADGSHSSLRQALLPDPQLVVLPMVTINGKRRIAIATFLELYAPNMDKSNVVSTKRGDIRLNISVDARMADIVSLSWTYSRPARGTGDPLHRPNRPLAGATDIPDEFFDELADLHRTGLPQPFHDMFDPSKLPKDRKLHWLMRSSLLPQGKLRGLAKAGIALIGDAAHTQPIVGGAGANAAMEDGVSLAECIAQGRDFLTWYETRYPAWKSGVEGAQNEIERLHKDEGHAPGKL